MTFSLEKSHDNKKIFFMFLQIFAKLGKNIKIKKLAIHVKNIKLEIENPFIITLSSFCYLKKAFVSPK